MSSDHAFVTLTLARICAAQGKLAQSREIYEQLLAGSPADTQLERELHEVDQRLLLETAAGEAADWVELTAQPGGLECHWSVSAGAVERARRQLGSDGALNLRCASFPFDPGLSLRDTTIDSASGTVYLTRPGGALLAAAAVGLLATDGRFVSMAHCAAVKLDGSIEQQGSNS